MALYPNNANISLDVVNLHYLNGGYLKSLTFKTEYEINSPTSCDDLSGYYKGDVLPVHYLVKVLLQFQHFIS